MLKLSPSPMKCSDLTGKSIIANGWKGAGIINCIREARDPHITDILDPFARLEIG